MATITAQVKNMRILIRRDTEENWARVNPILLMAEKGYEMDGRGMKIGDGVTRWNDLPYFVGFDIMDGGNPYGYYYQTEVGLGDSENINPVPMPAEQDDQTAVDY